MECSHDILDVEPSHDRNPRQPHPLPAPVPRRRRLRPVAHRRPMAERLPVSRLRPRPGVAAEDQEAQLRVHPLPSSNLGHRRHRTKLSLAIWFRTACLTATHCNGISALQLQKRLGIGSFRSARDLGNFAVRNTAATDGCSAVPRERHQPQSSVTCRPMKFSPGSTPRSPISRAGCGASITGCAPNLTPAAS